MLERPKVVLLFVEGNRNRTGDGACREGNIEIHQDGGEDVNEAQVGNLRWYRN